jgi:hypothetical protein
MVMRPVDTPLKRVGSEIGVTGAGREGALPAKGVTLQLLLWPPLDTVTLTKPAR